MRRVVVTGMGIVSSLGNTIKDVTESLKQSRSGITRNESFCEQGLRSQVSGNLDINPAELIERKLFRFMNEASGYGYLALRQAVEDSGLTPDRISNDRTGLIAGTGGPATEEILDSVEKFRKGGVRRVGPYRVTRGMCSSLSSVLSTAYGIRGVNLSVTSACATSAHCIGMAVEQIQLNKQDVMFAGGADSPNWSLALQFDAMGALSTRFNDEPEKASRPYDTDRDGFVISGGGGILVLEELEHAKARGAKIYGEVLGYAATSDGQDMVQPSGEGAERCMRLAKMQCPDRKVDYLNTHGTSTPAGDLVELRAIQNYFGSDSPLISSTKSLSGHGLGAAGVHEAIFSLIMLNEGFVCANANLENPDATVGDLPLVKQMQVTDLDTVMSNSFGFGGTNACLVLGRIA